MKVSRRDFIKKGADISVATGLAGLLVSASAGANEPKLISQATNLKRRYKRKVSIQKLTLKSFGKYGSFGNMLDPETTKLGAPPIEFYRDMVPLDLGDKTLASFSSARVWPRPPVINVMECHSTCCEGIMSIDADIFMFVGVATAKGQDPIENIEVFDVPRGTFISLLPGTWHHGPFVRDGKIANILIVLPRRTYVNDCTTFEIPEEDHIEIIGA
jgi:ureidoglycolate lyase